VQQLVLDGVDGILVVVAHPDDVDFGIAASVASWTDAGIAVTSSVTDGGAGGAELGIPDRRWARCGATSSGPRPQPSASTTSASSATPTDGSNRRSRCGAIWPG
jgi:hypothetical protein